ncbi:MAG: hydroxymethylbilane synthase [Nitrospinae bacterium]|nr:hydroxymethylbilane synthase [Nitrospinota bacterium]
MKKKLVIGTRGSQLALWQANWVRDKILALHPGVEVSLEKIKTKGDNILDVPLAKVGGKGLFVKEIEEALLDGRCDIAVHSLKDVPTEFPDGLFLAVYLSREDPRDALISRGNVPFQSLRSGAVIGTSSLRRQCQLLRHRPDLEMVDLRGNLDTRVRKLDTESMDAIIVASAGLNRLGMADRISEALSVDLMLPAIGQGIVSIEARKEDKEALDLILPLNHRESEAAALVERAFLKRLKGGCQVPIAAHALVDNGAIKFSGLLGSLDGKTIMRESASVDWNDPNFPDIGIALAEKILKRGGDKILAEVYGRENF